MGEVDGGKAKAEINFLIAECDDHLVRYGWWGRVNSQSLLMITNLFLPIHLMYYIQRSFSQYTALN